MSETFMAQNLNPYYTSNPKAERPRGFVVTPPETLPSSTALCKDSDMNKKLTELNKDIYQDSKTEKNKNFKNFLKYFSISLLILMCYRFIRSKL